MSNLLAKFICFQATNTHFICDFRRSLLNQLLLSNQQYVHMCYLNQLAVIHVTYFVLLNMYCVACFAFLVSHFGDVLKY